MLGMSRKNIAWGFVSAALLLVITTGCTSSPDEVSVPTDIDISKFSAVEAELNPATEQIVMPIDKYFLADDEIQRVGVANAMLIASCMEEAGFKFHTPEKQEASQPSPDRVYGIWNREAAEVYGYTIPGLANSASVDLEALNSAEAELSSGWDPAFEGCAATTELLPLLGKDYMDDSAQEITGPATKIASDAYVLASATDAWASAHADWSACLSESGLKPPTEVTDVLPEVPEALEEQIRAAVIDVDCKEETNYIHRVADLEAQYQAALIEGQTTALNGVSERVADIRVRVDEIITQ